MFRASTAAALLLAVAVLPLAAAAEGTTRPLPADWARSVVYFALDADGFNASGAAFETVRNATAALPGLTHVSLQWMYTVDSATGSNVTASPRKTPPVADIAAMVRFCATLGLRVMLKPLIVGPGAVQMFQLDPNDPAAFFASYTKQLQPVLDMAQDEGVDVFSVGLELQQISTNAARLPFWLAVIAEARGRCPACRLTYSCNPLLDENAKIGFWPWLDYVGVDLYAPFIVSRSLNATLPAAMPAVAEMTGVFTWVLERHVAQWYRAFAANMTAAGRNAPKLLIMEAGYPSTNVGQQSPWLPPANCSLPGPYGQAPNATAQAVAYAVAFDVLASPAYAGMFAGFTQFWLGMPGSDDFYPQREAPGSQWACGWTPIGKPATETIAAAFQLPAGASRRN